MKAITAMDSFSSKFIENKEISHQLTKKRRGENSIFFKIIK